MPRHEEATMTLDINWVRSQFPALRQQDEDGQSFFENAGGSFPCRQTIDALQTYYTQTKVQPYADYSISSQAGELMDRSRSRWADALGVERDEVQFGPSTSMNTYVLAQAFRQILKPGDEVVVTNLDHETNTGAYRRAAEESGATVREWGIDSNTGLLDPGQLDDILNSNTRLVTFPHCSNIVGQENDVRAISDAAHNVGARAIVDGVSYAPHGLCNVAELGCDVYLFSLYKVYSVHQGLMVTRNGIVDELPNQGHYFNSGYASKRLTPAGPDHAQEAAAGAVLDYIEQCDEHHGGAISSVRDSVARVSALWQERESALLAPVLEKLSQSDKVRLIGPNTVGAAGSHRCPTVAFVPHGKDPALVAKQLVERGVEASSGHFYAVRVLEGLGIDVDTGVVRVSWVHYTSEADIQRLLNGLDEVL